MEESDDEGEDPALDSLSQAIAFQVLNSSFRRPHAMAVFELIMSLAYFIHHLLMETTYLFIR